MALHFAVIFHLDLWYSCVFYWPLVMYIYLLFLYLNALFFIYPRKDLDFCLIQDLPGHILIYLSSV